MTCSAASTLQPQGVAALLPLSPPTTQGSWQRMRTAFQQLLQLIQGAGGSLGNNVIPQQYALIAGSTLPPISSTSNCTVSADSSTPLFGAGGSYKIAITGSPATVTFSADTAWPLSPGWQWLISFFQQASAAISGNVSITTPTKAYTTDFTTTLSSGGFKRLYDALNLGADTSTSFGLSFTFTGGTGQTVWLDGFMLEPYFNVVLQPSPFMSTSSALTLDNQPDGPNYVKLLGSHASGNVAYNFKGVWSSTTGYVTGDEVVYGTSYWLALVSSTNSPPATENANWQVVGSYSGFLGAWSSVTTYAAGAEVTYSGNYWVAVAQNSNSAPTTSNANWQIAGPTSLDYVPNGVARFAQGTMGNILNTTAWVHYATGSQGNFLDTATAGHVLASKIFFGGDAGGLPLGPYGGSELIWVGYGAATGGIYDGGWINTNDLKGIDPTKTYRASVWVCKQVASTGGQIYFGCDTTYTDNLDGTSNANPYFVSGENASAFATGQWYLMVGVIHGSGYSGAQSGLSGVWDAATGLRIISGSDYKCAAGAPQQTHRAFLYNDTAGGDNSTTDWVAFSRPRFEIMDGTEPTIASMLAVSLDGFPDGTTYLRMPTPPPASGSGQTSLTQSGTTTAINVGTGSFYLGNITVTANAGAVDPGAYGGPYYVYFDNPGYTGGAVTYHASTSILDTTRAPYRFYVGQITTSSGGGGTGGGGFGCFSGDTRIRTTDGFKRFDELPHVPFEIVNLTGRHRAKLLVHPNSLEPMRRMGPHLVTDRHLMRVGDEWMPASLLFHEKAPEQLRTVYNLHVLSEDPADHHYILENGLTAHNIKP